MEYFKESELTVNESTIFVIYGDMIRFAIEKLKADTSADYAIIERPIPASSRSMSKEFIDGTIEMLSANVDKTRVADALQQYTDINIGFKLRKEGRNVVFGVIITHK